MGRSVRGLWEQAQWVLLAVLMALLFTFLVAYPMVPE